jgi:hypothetical protein
MSTEISGHTRAVARSPLLPALRRASAPTWHVAAPRLTNGVRAVLLQEHVLCISRSEAVCVITVCR